jgi:CheY-like chemotaxis protein
VLLAVCGAISLWLNLRYKDRSEERALNVKALIERDGAKDEQLRHVRAHAARLAARVKELESLPPRIEANEARAAANEGKINGMVENLHSLGFFSPSSSSIPIYRPEAPRLPRSTVLVVEDDKDTVRVLCALFTAQGYATTSAVTVPEAMEKVSLYPHWIILDLSVAGGDGMDVLRRVKEGRMPVRTAVLTGTTDESRLASARELADIVFGKPVSAENFNRLLRLMDDVPKPPKTPVATGSAAGGPDAQ